MLAPRVKALEVVKLEMARVNVDILGISELKWTGMGEFNSDDHYVYYYFLGGTSGKEPLCQCRRCKRPRFDPSP